MFLNVFERFRIFSNTHFNTPALLIENRTHSAPKFTHLRRKSALLIEKLFPIHPNLPILTKVFSHPQPILNIAYFNTCPAKDVITQ